MSDKEKATEPDVPAPASDELKADDLEQIAGGGIHAGVNSEWVSVHGFSAGTGHEP